MIRLLFITLTLSLSAFAADDLLDDQVMAIETANYKRTLETTAENLKEVFERYEIALSRGYSITRELQVSGTAKEPTIQAGIRKCVAVICQEVDLDIALTIKPISGPCSLNYELKADLSRSGNLLTENYDFFATSICVTPTSEGASLRLRTTAKRAVTFRSGPVASSIKSFLRLQVGPISQALSLELAENSTRF